MIQAITLQSVDDPAAAGFAIVNIDRHGRVWRDAVCVCVCASSWYETGNLEGQTRSSLINHRLVEASSLGFVDKIRQCPNKVESICVVIFDTYCKRTV